MQAALPGLAPVTPGEPSSSTNTPKAATRFTTPRTTCRAQREYARAGQTDQPKSRAQALHRHCSRTALPQSWVEGGTPSLPLCPQTPRQPLCPPAPPPGTPGWEPPCGPAASGQPCRGSKRGRQAGQHAGAASRTSVSTEWLAASLWTTLHKSAGSTAGKARHQASWQPQALTLRPPP